MIDTLAAPRLISTARLYCLRLTNLDVPDMWALNDDPLTAATLTVTGQPLSEADQQAAIARALAQWEHHGYGLYTLHRVKDGAVIGYCGLMRRNMDGQSEVELAYALKSDYWGQGYTTEAARKVLDMGFKQMGLASIICMTLPENKRSRRVIEKCGFQFEKHVEHAGLPHYLYRLEA